MANRTFRQLQDDVLKPLGLSNDADTRESVRVWLNKALDTIVNMHPWTWNRRWVHARLEAPVTDGTIALTKDSTGVTLSGDTWDAAVVGRTLVRSLQAPGYRIEARPSTTTITLERAYLEASESGVGYYIVHDLLDVAGYRGHWWDYAILEAGGSERRISLVAGPSPAWRRTLGEPRCVRVLAQSGTTITLQVSPPPSVATTIRLPLLASSVDLDEEAETVLATNGAPEYVEEPMIAWALHQGFRMNRDLSGAESEYARFRALVKEAKEQDVPRGPDAMAYQPRMVGASGANPTSLRFFA